MSASSAAPERLVYFSNVRRRWAFGCEDPLVAVVELDLEALYRIYRGIRAFDGGVDGGIEELCTTDVAWTSLPSEQDGPPYDALMLVHDVSVQWDQMIWADGRILDAFDALHASPSSFVRGERGYTWRITHSTAGELRTAPLPEIHLLRAALFLGPPREVRMIARSMSSHCPEQLATALMSGVGPRFGVEGREITRRSIAELVGREELGPMLSHESDRVRKAASGALEQGPRLVS